MSSLVCIHADSGALRRYEVGGSAIRLTHKATPISGPNSLTPAAVESFRLNPPPEFSVEPPPRPTNSPASAGQIPLPRAA